MRIVLECRELLVLTAKGYPDFATRKFVTQLEKQGKQLFYIGDADPCGAEIFFTYVFGSLKFHICEQKGHASPLNINWVGPFMQDFPDNNIDLLST
jgi:DNA topoisomerase VI subunit A